METGSLGYTVDCSSLTEALKFCIFEDFVLDEIAAVGNIPTGETSRRYEVTLKRLAKVASDELAPRRGDERGGILLCAPKGTYTSESVRVVKEHTACER